jgi:hypothetical protein
MEPFTSLHIDIQNKRFDHSSRLFSSIHDSYMYVTTHLNDYRELIPEFYFQPEFLVNENEFDLGFARGSKVDDVALPPWAHKSPSEFVYVMRKALESEQVSAHLNDWIDLIWGYKQFGQAAIDSCNLYHPDFYENAWNKANSDRFPQIEATMLHIGQIPTRMFSKKHPEREPRAESQRLSQLVKLDFALNVIHLALVENNKVFVFGDNAVIRFNLIMGQEPTIKKMQSCGLSNEVQMMVVLPGDKVLCLLSTTKLLAIKGQDFDVAFPKLADVSYLASSSEYIAIVSEAATLNLISKHQRFEMPFYGDGILCCGISKTFGLVVGATVSGSIVFCSLFEGTKVNVVSLGDAFRPVKTVITETWGFVVTFATSAASGSPSYHLFMHNVNGRLIRTVQIGFAIFTWCSFASKKAFDYLVVADDVGRLFLLEAFYCDVKKPVHRCVGKIVGLSYLSEYAAIAAVRQDGHLFLLPLVVD